MLAKLICCKIYNKFIVIIKVLVKPRLSENGPKAQRRFAHRSDIDISCVEYECV